MRFCYGDTLTQLLRREKISEEDADNHLPRVNRSYDVTMGKITKEIQDITMGSMECHAQDNNLIGHIYGMIDL